MPTETTADAPALIWSVDAGCDAETQAKLDKLWASLHTAQQANNVHRDCLGQSCAVVPIVDVCAAMKVALERTARRVFHETLVHHYGTEFADVVSEQVFGGKQG